MLFERRKNSPVQLMQDEYLHPYRELLAGRRAAAEAAAERLAGGGDLLQAVQNHEFFGLHRNKCGDGSWIFREYAPNAQEIILTGDFSGWKIDEKYALKPLGSGIWEGRFPAETFCHGLHYKMLVRFPGGEGLRIPVYARYVVQDSESKEFAASVWEPEEPYCFRYPVPETSSPLIYEAHVGMAQEEEKVGSYLEFADRILPEVARKGYNTIQLMGIMEHPYYGSFGYHVANFFAVSSRFGTPDEFKYLVDEAHRLRLRVIIDLVHSHSVKNVAESPAEIDGSRTTYFHGGSRGEHPAWDSLCFDYGKDEVLKFLLSNCRFFLDEYHIDGYRFDGVTSMMYHHHGLDHSFSGYGEYFGSQVDAEALIYLTLANRVIHAVRPDAVTVAEDVSGMPGLANADGIGFDYRLAMGITDMWFKLLDKADETWSMFQLYGELTNRRCDEKSIGYVECHDQAIVGGQTAFFRMTDSEIYYNMHKNSGNAVIDRAVALHKMMRLATAAASGHGYLNFMGNEFGHPEWIDLPRAGNNWSMSHARRQWSLEKDENLRFGELAEFDRALLKLLVAGDLYNYPVQTVRIDESGMIIAFERGGYWFFFNFHPERSYEDYETEVLRGSYEMILDSDAAEFGGVISLYLPSRTALVLKRRG